MVYRLASGKDEGSIKELLKHCGLPWEDISPSHLCHFQVCESRGAVVGVVGLEVMERIALARSLAVQEQYRNQGCASQLVEKMEAYARSLGVETLYLLTMTAERFLTGKGYLRIDRKQVPVSLMNTSEFRDLCPVTAVCMLKQLNV